MSKTPTAASSEVRDSGGASLVTGPTANGGAFGSGNACCDGPALVPGTHLVPQSETQPELAWAQFPMLLPTVFPRRSWGATFWATNVVSAFAASPWTQTITVGPPPSNPDTIRDELRVLIAKARDRPAFAAEIVAQATNPLPYWSDLLNATATTHPATWDAIVCANEVGHVVAMYWKLQYKRPRPVQYYPALMPPILTPPHPAYPSGHALEAMTIARVVEAIIPALTIGIGTAKGPADTLARRIGENREIAGLHFPSDTAAGFHLADLLAPYLLQMPAFAEIVTAAQVEWSDIASRPFAPKKGGSKPDFTKIVTEKTVKTPRKPRPPRPL